MNQNTPEIIIFKTFQMWPFPLGGVAGGLSLERPGAPFPWAVRGAVLSLGRPGPRLFPLGGGPRLFPLGVLGAARRGALSLKIRF